MNWKEFLKPDKRKIVLAIILFGLVPFPMYSGFDCSRRPCLPIVKIGPSIGIINLMFFLFARNDKEIFPQEYPELALYPLILFLLQIIISYVLSCLISWAYVKSRGEKK